MGVLDWKFVQILLNDTKMDTVLFLTCQVKLLFFVLFFFLATELNCSVVLKLMA